MMRLCTLFSIGWMIFWMQATPLLAQQSKKSFGYYKKRAQYYTEQQQYDRALPMWLAAQQKSPKKVALKYNIGRCYFLLDSLDRSAEYLNFYLSETVQPEAEAYWLLAQSLHGAGAYMNAAQAYKAYLRRISLTHARRSEVKMRILQCLQGQQRRFEEQPYVVSTASAALNSAQDELAPVFHPLREDVLFYSAKGAGSLGGLRRADGVPDALEGSYRYDIRRATIERGSWSAGTPLENYINSFQHEILYDIAPDGKRIFYYKNWQPNTRGLFMQNFELRDDSLHLEVAMQPHWEKDAYWYGDVFVVSDSVVLLASDRPGGYGGSDLYYALRTRTGAWGPLVNLGPAINTPYAERSPSLSRDGSTLFFSSDNPSCMGGFDIFKSFYLSGKGTWSEAQPLPQPVNSPRDDWYFRMRRDGLSAYFSSNRVGGAGGFDLYSLFYRRPELVQQSYNATPQFVQDARAEALAAQQQHRDSSQTTTAPVATKPIDPTTYEVDAMYYRPETGKLLGGQRSIQTLVKLLQAHPKAKVILTAHTDNQQPTAQNLFFSVQQAELIAQQLIRQGAQASQIYLRGCGEKYPIALNETFSGAPNVRGREVNHRIEIRVVDADAQIKINPPTVSALMATSEGTDYRKRHAGLSYKVELRAQPSIYREPLLKQLPEVEAEKRAGRPSIFYMAGLTKSYADIVMLKDVLTSKGFSDLRIVPYIDGLRLEDAEVAQHIDRYPDLQQYLNSIK